jgi:predicted phosphoribosyltransferase
MPGLFIDRRDAGRRLAERVAGYSKRPDVLVLALPRGGVPVAYEVARVLNAPLDVFVVRKLGVPGYQELAMGAVATDGVRVLNEELIERLGIAAPLIDAVVVRERQELARRERLYRVGRPQLDVRGRTVILVDDGLATGATMQAAIEALRQLHPARIVVAVPTAPPDTCEEIKRRADEVVCAITPEPFGAVGRWYQDFSQTTDEEVRELLALQSRPDSEVVHSPAADDMLVKTLRETSYPLVGSARDYDPLIGRIGEARFALLRAGRDHEAAHHREELYGSRSGG